jgi:hypothetical protein
MRWRFDPGAIAVTLALAAGAAGQDDPGQPLTGVRGEPSQRGVIDLRQPPAARLAPLAPQEPEAIHPPMPPPRDRAGAVPRALLTPAAPVEPEAARSILPLGPSPAITEDFGALPDPNTVIPPDTHGAVGPSHLMVTLNSQVRVSDRDGTNPVDATLNGFWSPVGGGSGAFDPRVIYDPYADRWITVACDNARSTSSAILLAVTQTGDPGSIWDGYAIDADSGNLLWADFPSIGFNSKWVVVQVNMFTISMPNMWQRSHIYIFDRAMLYAGSAPFTLIQDVNGFTQAPAHTYDMAQNDLYLVEDWNSGLRALRLSRISGSVGSEALSVVGFPLASAPWQFAPPVADHAPQLGSAQKIATNDSRIQNLVYRNGSLWTTHTVFSSTPAPDGRASVQWWQISTAGSTLQDGRIDDPLGDNFYAFPSIAVNTFSDALLGFSCFAGTRYASACYAFRKSTDAPGTFQDVATLKEGLASYYKTFSGTVNRWGDYSATVVDPANDVDLWTIQEYAAQPANLWGTWWGHLALPPDITIDDVSLAEGNSGTTTARFTVSLSFPSTQTVEVDWVAANGTATLADSDFQSASGRTIFPPGSTAQFIDVPVVGDLKFEADETFVVNLSSPLFGVITDAQGQATILNDDPLPRLSIDDVRIVEGNAGPATATFTLTWSNPSAMLASVTFNTSDGSAVQPSDYGTNFGILNFFPDDTPETLNFLVQGDMTPEPNETFHVDLSAPSGVVLADRRGVATILDDDGPAQPDVSSFTIVSDGGTTATSGHNRLQWLNPVGGSPIELRIRFNKGNPCVPPDPAFPAGPSFDVISLAPSGAPGEARFHDHNTLDLGTSYCYTFWVIHSGSVASAGVSGIGRPFNATAKLKWKYATGTGTTGVAPPTVALDGVFAVDNSGDVHAMQRSATGGPWPAGPPVWYPTDFASPSQARNPIVPLGLVSSAFITTQDGRVHSVDTKTGAVNWSRALSPAAVNGAPAGIFTAFGGEHDAIFVGTSAGDNNVFHALDPGTGGPITSFGPPGNPGIGPILAMAAVDYSRNLQNRVYFATRKAGAPQTLWCLELGPAGPVSFTLKWKVDLGNINGSPVLRNGRIYVGTEAGEVKSVRADDGMDVRTVDLLDGPIKGFVFPDRASDDVYVSTDGKVWRLTDTAGGWVNPWGAGVGVSVPNPSTPLLRPGATHVYVGGGDGQLYQLTLPGGALTSIALDYDPAAFVVGAPSYDTGFGLIHVGSVRGVFYAVEVPLP